jgi:transposase
MPVPRPKGSADLIADRRRRALALLKSGLSLNEVARRIQCVASSVMRWRDAWQRHGSDALKVGSSPGRPLKLKSAQRRRLVKSLSKGPLAHGYNTNVWTTARIAELIRREFGVSYHRDHVGRLMHTLHWSHQKPEKRAVERDEETIEHWKRKDWPRVKKTLLGWAPTSSLPTNRDSC